MEIIQLVFREDIPLNFEIFIRRAAKVVHKLDFGNPTYVIAPAKFDNFK
jgi:hypothetical protein